jgi:4-amino-4-deoxychorismate lyase
VVPVTDHPAPLTALLDGTLLPPETPLLRPDDLGVLRGEGVFETTLVVDGVARDLDDHLARLAISAEMTGLVVPAPDRWRTGVDALVKAWTGDRQMVLRLVVSRGPESAVEPVCYLLGGPLSPASRRQRTDGVRVLLLDRGFTARTAADATWLLAGAKTLSYGVNMAALRYAAANEADDVIFLGSDGAVLEAPTASVVVANGRTLSTPPRDGILDGITVRRLFRAARDAGWSTTNQVLTRADLHAAAGVWLVSSARLIAPVISIEGAPRDDHGLTAEIAALLEVPGDVDVAADHGGGRIAEAEPQADPVTGM